MKSEFKKLLFNPLCRMSEVKRYSGVHQESDETLSDHITDVCLISYLIYQTLTFKYGETDLNKGKLLEKALLHDIDEVLTGDIPRNTKYATKEVHSALNDIAVSAIAEIEESMTLDLHDTWNNAKKEKEGLILKLADILCVVRKTLVEIELRGNKSFLKVADELRTHLLSILDSYPFDTFNSGSSVYLQSVMSEACDEISYILKEYSGIRERFNLKDTVLR